jgi:hypothetical protein
MMFFGESGRFLSSATRVYRALRESSQTHSGNYREYVSKEDPAKRTNFI